MFVSFCYFRLNSSVRDLIISIFFPKRCVNCRAFGKYICNDCFTKIQFLDFSKCIECMRPSVSSLTHGKCKKRNSLDGVFVTAEYKSVIKKAVYKYKYEPYIYNLARPLSSLMYENLIQNEIFMGTLSTSSNVWITCVPLHEKRLRTRGYNQSEKLAKNLSESLNLRFNPNLIKRTRDTVPQFKLKKEERTKNIKDAFSLNPKYKGRLSGKTLFIVDDVFTSGVTLRECGKLLKKGGAKEVYGLVLAMER